MRKFSRNSAWTVSEAAKVLDVRRATLSDLINGNAALTHFDIIAAAGGKNRAIRREFTVTADSQGRIVIDFVSVVNFAKVSGIAVY